MAGSFIALVLCVERMSRERNELPIGFRASPVVKAKTSLFRAWNDSSVIERRDR